MTKLESTWVGMRAPAAIEVFQCFFASGIVNSKPGPTQNPSVAMPGATATRDASGKTAEMRGPWLGENCLQRRDFSGFKFQWGRNVN